MNYAHTFSMYNRRDANNKKMLTHWRVHSRNEWSSSRAESFKRKRMVLSPTISRLAMILLHLLKYPAFVRESAMGTQVEMVSSGRQATELLLSINRVLCFLALMIVMTMNPTGREHGVARWLLPTVASSSAAFDVYLMDIMCVSEWGWYLFVVPILHVILDCCVAIKYRQHDKLILLPITGDEDIDYLGLGPARLFRLLKPN